MEGASSGTKAVRCFQFVNHPLFHSIHPRICPLCSGFPSPTAKRLHIVLSPVSPCATLRSVTLSPAPSVHVTLGVPFHHVPLGSHLGFSRANHFLAFTLRIQTMATAFFNYLLTPWSGGPSTEANRFSASQEIPRIL
jgi:hypothetical protein